MQVALRTQLVRRDGGDVATREANRDSLYVVEHDRIVEVAAIKTQRARKAHTFEVERAADSRAREADTTWGRLRIGEELADVVGRDPTAGVPAVAGHR